ncbi:MAG: hypothetical protein LQ349_006472 [Xanthoria aureola]|nr:MAG: hypothetical protein LQ349_006472 [Xanthoria aureola]
MSLKRRLALEKELDRRAIQAGRAEPSPPPPKLSPVQASIAARKERTLASLGPKAGKAARQHMLDVEMEKERLALQLKREQLERQVPAASTQGAARKRVAWAGSEKRVHMVESYKKLNQKINQRYEVANEFIALRRQVDAAGGWTSSSTLEGVHRVRAPGWMSVDGYQSMPDDWKDIEDNMEDDNETF